jgi:hypothetical protein
MKPPRVSFDKDKVLEFLLAHGDKFVVGMVALGACGLAWGGVSAVRTMRPSQQQQPDAIVADAALTAKHIEEVKIVPDDELTTEKGLAKIVAKWLSPKVAPAATHAMFNKPLVGELAKRSSPDILPIEDLRAVASVAVLAVKPKAAGDRPAPDRPLNLDPGPAGKPPRQGRGARPAGPIPAGPQVPPDMGMVPPQADQNLPQGKVVPYVLVTGLIPVAKQWEEYDRRFETASLRDAVRDTPSWSSYRIEKTEVLPGTAEKWTPIDPKAVARRYAADWAGVQPEPLVTQILLSPELERRDPAQSPLPFSIPMPQLKEGSWGFNALHPWFADFLQRDAEAKKAQAQADQENAEANTNVFGGVTGGLVPNTFSPPGMTEGPGAVAGFEGPAGMPGAQGIVPKGLEYRLFRFIDLAVVPGRTYRYRVKAVCLNPNLNVPSRHLVDAAVAKQPTLESPVSAATSPVVVPDGIRMLVQPMKKQDLKRLKPGTFATMILAQTSAGAYGLRWLLMEVGGLANVDPLLNKRGDPRSRGEAVVTDRVLLDVRGRPEDRAETRTGKPTPPPEPLEMIFLRPDGTYEVASSADSQADVDRYLPMLQANEAAPAGDRPAQPPAGGDSPFGNPFAPKK